MCAWEDVCVCVCVRACVCGCEQSMKILESACEQLDVQTIECNPIVRL